VSFGKVKEAVAALERAGQFPPNLTPGERNDRIGKKLKELGYKEVEIPPAAEVSPDTSSA